MELFIAIHAINLRYVHLRLLPRNYIFHGSLLPFLTLKLDDGISLRYSFRKFSHSILVEAEIPRGGGWGSENFMQKPKFSDFFLLT